MNTKKIILIIVFILLSSFVYSISEPHNFYNFNSDYTDAIENNDGSGTDTSFTIGLIEQGVNFTGTTDKVTLYDRELQNSMSFNFWVKMNNWDTSSERLFSKGNTGGAATSSYLLSRYSTTDQLEFFLGCGGSNYNNFRTNSGLTNIADNNWHMITIIINTYDDIEFWFDGTLYVDTQINNLCNSYGNTATNLLIGFDEYYIDANDFEGQIDMFGVWLSDITLDIPDLYKLGVGIEYPFLSVQNFSIISKSFWDNSSLLNFSANIDGINYTTTTGTIITPILDNSTETYEIQIFADSHFNQTYNNTNVSSPLTAYLKQSDISFACYEKVSNNTISCDNTTIYPNTGDYNFTISSTGYYDVTQEETITALQNETINIYGFYSTNLTINNNFTEGAGGDCEYIITGITTPTYIETINTSWVGLINGTYNIQADCDGYAYTYQNVTIENTTQEITFDLYITNQIKINIYDETTGNIITENITVTKTIGASQSENITNTGTITYKQLTAGNYTFTFTNDNYPKRSYTVTIGERSYQTLNVYLLTSTDELVLALINDENRNEYLEGVTVSVSKIINGTDTVLAVLESDITGRVQFVYTTGEKYCFSAQITGYELKEWCFDPVIFAEYNILMTPTTTIEQDTAYREVIVELQTLSYWNGANNTIKILFASPSGNFEEYGFTATTTNGQNITASNNNAYGELLQDTIEITGASYGDTITIKYYYDAIDQTRKNFTQVFHIIGYDSTQNQHIDNQDETYGLGLFERTLITVLAVLFVVGAGAYFAGNILAGGFLGLFVMGYLTYIGFMDKWIALISMTIMFVLIAWGNRY